MSRLALLICRRSSRPKRFVHRRRPSRRVSRCERPLAAILRGRGGRARRISEQTTLDVGCDTGHLPIAFRRGALRAVGCDREPGFDLSFALLNEIIGSRALFQSARYDPRVRAIPKVEPVLRRIAGFCVHRRRSQLRGNQSRYRDLALEMRTRGILCGHDCELCVTAANRLILAANLASDGYELPGSVFRHVHPGTILAVDEAFRGSVRLWADTVITLPDGAMAVPRYGGLCARRE